MSAPASGRRAPATRAGTLPAGLTAAALIDLIYYIKSIGNFDRQERVELGEETLEQPVSAGS